MLDGIQKYFIRRGLDKVRDKAMQLGDVDTKIPIYAQLGYDELERGDVKEAKKHLRKVQTELKEYRHAAEIYETVVRIRDKISRVEKIKEALERKDQS
jgi:Tfp pilus assembly protein PilF